MKSSLYSTLSEKGQITIPASIRNKMQLHAGNRFEFLDKGNFMIEANNTYSNTIYYI
jgi:AbrB family looped-hinge helix DNA binding protein